MNLAQFVGYRKLGGWLRFFQVITIIGLISSAISLFITLISAQTAIFRGTSTPVYLIYSVLVGILSIIFSSIQLRLISKRDNRLSKIFLTLSSISFVISIVGLFIPKVDDVKLERYIKSLESQFSATGIDPSILQASMTASTSTSSFLIFITLLYSAAWIVVWFIYFKKSERVRIYMLSEQQWNQEYFTKQQYQGLYSN